MLRFPSLYRFPSPYRFSSRYRFPPRFPSLFRFPSRYRFPSRDSRDVFVEISHLQGLVHALEAQLSRQKAELTARLKRRHTDLVHELYGNAFKLKGEVSQ